MTETLPDQIDDEDQDHAPELAGMLDQVAAASAVATTADGTPPLLVAGTFALYADRNGGVIMVMDVKDGVMAPGVHRNRIPPGMVRALAVLAGGGGKTAAIRAALGRGKRGTG